MPHVELREIASPNGTAMTLDRPTDWLPNPPDRPAPSSDSARLSWLPEASDWTPGTATASAAKATRTPAALGTHSGRRVERPGRPIRQKQLPKPPRIPRRRRLAVEPREFVAQHRIRKILTTVLPFSTFVAAGLCAAWLLRDGQRNWTWWFGVFGAGLTMATVVRWVADLGPPRWGGQHESPTSTLDGAVAGMACALFLVVGFLLLPQSFEDRNGPKLVGDPAAEATPKDAVRTVDDAATTAPGVPVEIAVLANDSGPFDRTNLIIPVSTLGALITPEFTVQYTPPKQATGEVTFAYRVCDTPHRDCSQAVIHITIKR